MPTSKLKTRHSRARGFSLPVWYAQPKEVLLVGYDLDFRCRLLQIIKLLKSFDIPSVGGRASFDNAARRRPSQPWGNCQCTFL
jgi:hypothetical protein